MEFIVELVVELLLQLVVEVVIEFGLRGLAKILSTRAGQMIFLILLNIGAGFGLGHVWGSHVASTGQLHTPRSIWVSLAFAGFATVLALLAARDSRWQRRFSELPPALRLSAFRLGMFVLLNLALAAGISVGFSA